MKYAIISGSTRNGRQTHKIASFLQELALSKGMESTLLDVLEYDFPVFDERLSRLETPHPRMEEFASVLAQADGIIIVTPEYNGGMSGSLKNTLDYFYEEYKKKPMGAVTVSGGPFGGINAFHQTLFWINYVGGIASPTRLMVSDVQNAFDEKGKPNDRLDRGAQRFLDDLQWLTEKVRG